MRNWTPTEMMKSLFRAINLVGLLLLFFLLSGCEQKASDYGNEVLLRVGDRVVTVFDFKEAFEISKTAYAQNIRQQDEDFREAQIRLLNQLAIEMVILERAEELEISVSDDELQKAVSEIKSDYPEGEFEQTLIESAISYDSWRDQLKTRLTMEKVIDAELKNRITISSEDIAQHYKKNYQDQEIEPDSAQSSEDINEAIVMQLRREKAEQAYNAWIENLKAKYAIEINNEQWDKITDPKILEANETDAGNSKNE
jgi:hypothetical protein